MSDSAIFQREVAQDLTSGLSEVGFALAGSGAVREHGLIDRPTEDIDLFTIMPQRPNFKQAVREGKLTLEQLGFLVVLDDEHPFTDTFAKLKVSRGNATTEVDMCIDWREYPPTWIDGVGWVLDIRDAVANKIDTVVSRGEARDFLDALSIRRSRRFTDDELFQLAHDHDDTFTPELFAQSLGILATRAYEHFRDYVTPSEFASLVFEAHQWIDDIHARYR